MKNKRLLIVTISILFCFSSITIFAHSGDTDHNGGHYNHSTGDYHYHHGYPEHYHENGICPYEEATEQKKSKEENKKITVADIFGAIVGIIFVIIPLIFSALVIIVLPIWTAIDYHKKKK